MNVTNYFYVEINFSVLILPEGIIYLEYSESQRLFHFDNHQNNYPVKLWVRLKAMTYEEAIDFAEFMDKKYVNGRQTGNLPELKIVKLELALFFELKTFRGKLAGR